ncbi:MAG: tetratricopeptide repeat protein [Deltaproteobacteria bacterium]
MLAPRLAIFLALAAATALAASRLHVEQDRPYDLEGVPRAGPLRFLFLGNRTLAADVNWLRAVQYIGEVRGNERGWDKLYPLVDAVTDLDPGHAYAYQVAGAILSSVGRVEESNRILEKGVRAVPERYILPYHRAFNAFYYQGDWKEAGRWAEVAARSPGAPPHLRQNVIAYYVKGKRADAAIAFLEQALAEARDPDTRKALESQLRQARLELDASRLEDAIATWRARYVVGPLALGQLLHEGLLRSIPPDPHGGELYLDDEGRVRSTENPFRFARPESPSEMQPAPRFYPAAKGAPRP